LKSNTLVLSFLYPNDAQPIAGVFVRERISRVAKISPLFVVSPQPWSPFDALIRRFLRKGYRPKPANPHTIEDGVKVYRPRFLSLPGILRSADGLSMALSVRWLIHAQKLLGTFDLIDAHFAFPDGYAAYRLSRWFKVPYCVTLRGAKDTDTIGTPREGMLKEALHHAKAVIGVSDSLRQFAVDSGTPNERACAITNGVDGSKFFPESQHAARQKLAIPLDAKVMVSVGSLIPLKGHHRVIEVLPALVQKFPNLLLLVVGGSTSFGDTTGLIQQTIATTQMQNHVRLCGRISPADLRWYLSASDLFVLATENEGWPNALMEALACGLPLVTTRVGGNAEIVCSPAMGSVVPYWDPAAFEREAARWLTSSTDAQRAERMAWIGARTWDRAAARVKAVWEAK
jgi:teichuronic acid biosynthesis glycosyltransferase TuaC